jgi:hypothetical protein
MYAPHRNTFVPGTKSSVMPLGTNIASMYLRMNASVVAAAVFIPGVLPNMSTIRPNAKAHIICLLRDAKRGILRIKSR